MQESVPATAQVLTVDAVHAELFSAFGAAVAVIAGALPRRSVGSVGALTVVIAVDTVSIAPQDQRFAVRSLVPCRARAVVASHRVHARSAVLARVRSAVVGHCLTELTLVPRHTGAISAATHSAIVTRHVLARIRHLVDRNDGCRVHSKDEPPRNSHIGQGRKLGDAGRSRVLVRVRSGSVAGIEANLSWSASTCRSVSPRDFLVVVDDVRLGTVRC